MLRNALCDICPPGSKDIDIRLHQTCTAILFSKPPKPSNQDSSHWKFPLPEKNKKRLVQRLSFPYKLVIYKPIGITGHHFVAEAKRRSSRPPSTATSLWWSSCWSLEPPWRPGTALAAASADQLSHQEMRSLGKTKRTEVRYIIYIIYTCTYMF